LSTKNIKNHDQSHAICNIFAQRTGGGAEADEQGRRSFLFAEQEQEMRGMVLKIANTPFPPILAGESLFLSILKPRP
jgi:hypothetical protein